MNNPNLPSPGKDWPDDLRAWVDEQSLVRFTFDAVHALENRFPSEQTHNALASGTPRVFLTLLTYAYAIGVFDAEEIQRQVRTDPQLKYLAARTAPTAPLLREFRRGHRDWVEGSLRALFQRVWEFRAARSAGGWTLPPADDLDPQIFESAAQDRVERALLADSMALDT